MRLRGISTIKEGNRFLPEFIEEYNWKFGKEASSPEDAHRPLREEDNLERIFARRAKRKVSKTLGFQYEGKEYQLQFKYPNRFRHTHVNILDRLGKPILIESEGEDLAYTKWEETYHGSPKVLDSKELEAHWPKRNKRKPGKHHPWR